MSSTAVTVFKVLAGMTSVMMLLSPSPAIYRIHKTHEIGHTSIIPLASLLANSHVWLIYGYLDNLIFPVFVTFVFGDMLAVLYIAVYYRWTTERAYVRKVLAVVTVGIAIVSIYAILGGLGHTNQTREQVNKTSGYIADCVAFMLYGSPLEKIFHVLKNKSAVFIPILMVVAAVTNNIMWFTYGMLLTNWIIIIPNMVFMTIGFSQIILYLIYNPKTHPLVTPMENQVDKGDHGTISIIVSPKADQTQESPNFALVRSPLAPINT